MTDLSWFSEYNKLLSIDGKKVRFFSWDDIFFILLCKFNDYTIELYNYDLCQHDGIVTIPFARTDYSYNDQYLLIYFASIGHGCNVKYYYDKKYTFYSRYMLLEFVEKFKYSLLHSFINSVLGIVDDFEIDYNVDYTNNDLWMQYTSVKPTKSARLN